MKTENLDNYRELIVGAGGSGRRVAAAAPGNGGECADLHKTDTLPAWTPLKHRIGQCRIGK